MGKKETRMGSGRSQKSDFPSQSSSQTPQMSSQNVLIEPRMKPKNDKKIKKKKKGRKKVKAFCTIQIK